MSAKLPCGKGMPVPWSSLPASINAVPPFLLFHPERSRQVYVYEI
jgi:hypothetical protein